VLRRGIVESPGRKPTGKDPHSKPDTAPKSDGNYQQIGGDGKQPEDKGGILRKLKMLLKLKRGM